MVEVGKIVRPHGVLGEVKTRVPEELVDIAIHLSEVLLSGEALPRKVIAGRVHQGAWLLKLEGITTRNDAEALRGRHVSVQENQLPRTSDEAVMHTDLVGLAVRDRQGVTLGILTEVLATGSNDVYVIKRTGGGELLLPALESVVQAIDLTAGNMTVVVPDGL